MRNMKTIKIFILMVICCGFTASYASAVPDIDDHSVNTMSNPESSESIVSNIDTLVSLTQECSVTSSGKIPSRYGPLQVTVTVSGPPCDASLADRMREIITKLRGEALK
jgi:hypothetical protein